ncbi:MAG: hypothetical protein OHK0015_54720 [Chloroflexi bacterium OHK40]
MTSGSSSSSSSPRRRGRSVSRKPDRRWIWWLVGGTVAVALGVGVTTFLRSQSQRADLSAVQTFPKPEAGHQDGPLTYAQTPPAGGVHNAVWQNCGIYDQPVANENAVHSQEHGAVWVTYRPDLSAEAVEVLRGQIRGKRYTLLSPFPDLPAPVVASAWGVQLQLDGPDDPRLAAFITTYAQGSQAPEPGAVCHSGTGIPTDM